MATFNLGGALRGNGFYCVPAEQKDPETDCRACSATANADYEQCRQSYYLKKQTELLRTEQQTTHTQPQQRVIELENLLQNKNQQIEHLIYNEKQTTQRIEKIQLINTVLIILLVTTACLFLTIKLTKQVKQRRK